MGKLAELTQHGIRQARRVFHLLVSAAFIILGILGVIVSYGEWRVYERVPADGLVKFWVVAGFTAFLFILGLYTFAKARSVR